MAVTGLILCTIRPSSGFSLAVFAVFAFLGGARTIAGGASRLQLVRADPLRAMSLRTASVQLGYLAGAGVGGIGLAVAGWAGLGVVLATMLMISAALLAARGHTGREALDRSTPVGASGPGGRALPERDAGT